MQGVAIKPIMLCVVMLSVAIKPIMLSFIMLSVANKPIMEGAVMLAVLAAIKQTKDLYYKNTTDS